MEQRYFVEVHMCANDGNWGHKTTINNVDINLVKKDYHAQLSNYINNPNFTFVQVKLVDVYGNVVMKEYWEKPQPIPTPEEPTETVEE